MKRLFYAFALLLFASPARAEEAEFTYRISGLFSPDRVEDLKKAVESVTEFKLLDVDYKTAQGKFRFDPKAFPGAKPEKYYERLDSLVRNATRSTMGVKPLSAIPREQQVYVEIPVVGLDCKACCLAAYETIAKVDGVEQATASFRDGLMTAWIDPAKTDKAKLEAIIKQRGIYLKPAAGEKTDK